MVVVCVGHSHYFVVALAVIIVRVCCVVSVAVLIDFDRESERESGKNIL